jgi:hypothetical protein
MQVGFEVIRVAPKPTDPSHARFKITPLLLKTLTPNHYFLGVEIDVKRFIKFRHVQLSFWPTAVICLSGGAADNSQGLPKSHGFLTEIFLTDGNQADWLLLVVTALGPPTGYPSWISVNPWIPVWISIGFDPMQHLGTDKNRLIEIVEKLQAADFSP